MRKIVMGFVCPVEDKRYQTITKIDSTNNVLNNVPGSIPGCPETMVKKQKKDLCPPGLILQWKKTEKTNSRHAINK